MRTDTRVVFNPHDINAMAVWEVHTDSALSQKGLLAAARSAPLDFDEWAAMHDHTIDPKDRRGAATLLSMFHMYLTKANQESTNVFNFLTQLDSGFSQGDACFVRCTHGYYRHQLIDKWK